MWSRRNGSSWVRLLVAIVVLAFAATGVAVAADTRRASAIEICPEDDPTCVPIEDPTPGTGPGAPDPPPPGNTETSAALSWSLAPRFDAVWDSFDTGPGYDHGLVDPDHWTVHLDACASTNAVSYDFDAPDAISVSPEGCRADVRFREEGSYPVSVTVASPTGSDTAGDDVAVDDLFIVSLGDSAASGEGNPDHLHGIGGDEWQDPRCHRSAKSGMARAAAALETPQRSVTFVSFACSGAEIEHILDTQYDGISPDGGPLMPPQLQALDQLLCDGPALNCISDPRPVDAIWISVGINDVKFSDILIECAYPTADNCHTNSSVVALATNGRTEIRNRAVDLDDALSNREGLPAGTLEHANVYLTEYPDDLFDSEEACGAFNVDIADLFWPDFGIIDITEGVIRGESRWLHETGVALNELIFELTVRHGWHYVDGISEDFAGHGYCSSEPWFRHLSESFFVQGDYKGVVHPNDDGHENIAQHVLETVAVPVPPRPPARDVTLVVEAVKVVDGASVPEEDGVDEDERRLILSNVLTAFKQGVEMSSDYLNSPTNGAIDVPLGEWVELSPRPELHLTADKLQTLRVETYTVLPNALDRAECHEQDEDCSNRPARSLNAARTHRVADGSPAGDQFLTAEAESSKLEVRYHLTIASVQLGQEHAGNRSTEGTSTESVEGPIDVLVHAPGPVVSGSRVARR
jgi:hypothetical protein